MIRFTIPGDPVGKGRPRLMRTKAGGVHIHTPDATLRFEERVRYAALAAGARPLEGPLAMEIRCFFALPKSRCRKRKPRGQEWKTSIPDLDNLIKAIADALNGLAFADDSQVVQVVARKFVAAQGEPARTHVAVYPAVAIYPAMEIVAKQAAPCAGQSAEANL